MWESDCEESWAQKNWCFELWCWRRLWRVPWTARRSNQSIVKEISPGCPLEGLMLKLKLHTLATWCEELTHWKRPCCWEGLGAGGEGDNRGWDGWMASPTQWTWVWVNFESWWWTGRPGVLQFMGSQRVGHNWATELNWTEHWDLYFYELPAGQGKETEEDIVRVSKGQFPIGLISRGLETSWVQEQHQLFSSVEGLATWLHHYMIGALTNKLRWVGSNEHVELLRIVKGTPWQSSG